MPQEPQLAPVLGGEQLPCPRVWTADKTFIYFTFLTFREFFRAVRFFLFIFLCFFVHPIVITDQIKDLTAQTTGAISFISPPPCFSDKKAERVRSVWTCTPLSWRCSVFSLHHVSVISSPPSTLPHNNSAALAGAAAPRG